MQAQYFFHEQARLLKSTFPPVQCRRAFVSPVWQHAKEHTNVSTLLGSCGWNDLCLHVETVYSCYSSCRFGQFLHVITTACALGFYMLHFKPSSVNFHLSIFFGEWFTGCYSVPLWLFFFNDFQSFSETKWPTQYKKTCFWYSVLSEFKIVILI